MAVPKRRHSKMRRDKRRANSWKLRSPARSSCNQCGVRKLPHRICWNCGFYGGDRVVIADAS
jgi:large subunit ribosomal protein L32